MVTIERKCIMSKISVKNADGTMEEVDLINAFKIKEINKRFVILSKGEKVGDGKVLLAD